MIDYANFQQSAEKVSKQLESQLSEANSRIDEANRIIADLNSGKSRLQTEGSDLTRQLEEAESRVGQLTKEKSSLASQLDEAKRSVEEESRVCNILLMIEFFFYFRVIYLFTVLYRYTLNVDFSSSNRSVRKCSPKSAISMLTWTLSASSSRKSRSPRLKFNASSAKPITRFRCGAPSARAVVVPAPRLLRSWGMLTRQNLKHLTIYQR